MILLHPPHGISNLISTPHRTVVLWGVSQGIVPAQLFVCVAEGYLP